MSITWAMSLLVPSGRTLSPGQRIREEYKDYKNDAKTREDYLSTLQRHYFEVRPQLTEYRLSLEYLFDLAVSDGRQSLGSHSLEQAGPGGRMAWKNGKRGSRSRRGRGRYGWDRQSA